MGRALILAAAGHDRIRSTRLLRVSRVRANDEGRSAKHGSPVTGTATMATILSFKSSQRPSVAAILRAAGMSAEIVLFPGVRYERWAEVPRDTKPAKRAKRRDKIELED
jgi:hypothetical protein